MHASFTEHLAGLPEKSCDAYVLLDAQDWMTDEQLTALWTRDRRARRGRARASSSAPPARRRSCRAACRTRSSRGSPTTARRCRALSAKDRSSIYGGFHLYVLAG